MSLAELNNMTKEFNPFNAMKDDVTRSDFLLKNISKANQYSEFREGKFNIPAVTAQHSNVRSGKLTAINDITKGEHAKMYIEGSDLTTLNGSITFTEEEIRAYGSPKRAFIKLFPDKVDELMANMKEMVSTRFLLDGSLSKCTGYVTDGTDGHIAVSRVERLHKKQRLDFSDGVTTVVGIIDEINMNEDTVKVVDAAGAPLDLSVATGGMTAAADIKLYIYDDANKSKITLKSLLLPQAQGGSSDLHHVSKMASPILQAQYIDGSSFSASTILDDFFKKVHQPVKQKGKVKVPSYAVPYKVFNDLVLKAQSSKRFSADEVEANYGYDKVCLRGAGGKIDLYGVFDLESEGFAIDWDKLMWVSPEMFTTRREFGHEPWFIERTEDNGYVYVMDVMFKGTIGIKGKASGFAVIDNLNY